MWVIGLEPASGRDDHPLSPGSILTCLPMPSNMPHSDSPVERNMFQEYPQNDVNVPILLHQGRFRLKSSERIAEGPGSARLLWLPSPGIEVAVETSHAGIDLDSVTVELPGFETENVVVQSATLGPQGRIRAFVSGMESRSDQDLVSVGFQLVNFSDIITPGLFAAPGDPTTLTHAGGQTQRLLDRGGAVTCSTARLEHDGWQVDLAAAPDSADVYKGLESSGGYAFTHVGRLTRVDGSAFTADRSIAILESLTAFLTFARGAACSIPIRWGCGTAGEVAWRQFGSPVVDRWPRGRPSWLDKFQGAVLTELFDAFCRTCNDSALREPFALALHWYRHCNTGSSGLEGSLVLGMAALDLLSALIVVERNGDMSAAKHDKLPAAEKLCLLLRALNVRTDIAEIPPRFKALAAFAESNRMSDSCKALVELRNGFVHSIERRRKIVFAANGKAATSDAWQLSLWYQELALLRLLGHQGSYANRTTNERWVGQIEPVPWCGSGVSITGHENTP